MPVFIITHVIFRIAWGAVKGKALNHFATKPITLCHWSESCILVNHGDILAVPGMKRDGTQIPIEFTIAQVRDNAGG